MSNGEQCQAAGGHCLSLAWLPPQEKVGDCEFEIVYNDGFRICGAYRFQCKGKSRPQLMRYVCENAHAIDGGAEPSLRHGLGARPFDFTDYYETDDFPLF